MVEKLSSKRVDESHIRARETIEELFRTDEEGTPSLDAVRMLVKMFKVKGYAIHESVLNTFLSLRLLTELAVKASTEKIDRDGDDMEPTNFKKRKRAEEKKVFKTKRQKKIEKEQNSVLKELKEADAVVSVEEREKMQGEMLKLVFTTYLRILKERPEGNLMAATLEGLAKYAHLINIEFFNTLLTALKELIQDATTLSSPYFLSSSSSSTQATRESLLCITTAFALLGGQASDTSAITKAVAVLPMDLSFFTSHLYSLLLPLSLNPDIELSKKSLRLPDPDLPYFEQHKKKVNLATQIELLLRCLTAVLSPPFPPRPPPSRITGFMKRMLTSSLHFPEKTTLATLGVLGKVGRKNAGKVGGLFRIGEKVGDGDYKLWVPAEESEESEDDGEGGEEDVERIRRRKWRGEGIEGIVERSNPFAATAWEMDLLKRHYSPKVAKAATEAARGILGAEGGERSVQKGVKKPGM